MGEFMSRNWLGNFFGSFADAAVLFPLLLLLGQKTNFQISTLFFFAGVLVIFSGLYFRVPMAVQPLKSIAIAALAVGATAAEIQISMVLLSAVFFFLLSLKSEKWLQLVPESWVHALQLSLGLLLINQGVDAGLKAEAGLWGVLILAVPLVALMWSWDWPFLGMLATLALGFSLVRGLHWSEPTLRIPEFRFGVSLQELRWPLILNLLLPQLALTTANSVIATENVCRRYFGQAASGVTASRLMKTIAVSNFVSAVFGGLPMCHGSGGVTALFKGGARHWTSNLYLGCFLLLLTLLSCFYDVRHLQFPQVILGALLAVVGVYHLLLARPTWESGEGKARLLAAAVLVLWTKNLLLVLASQVLISIFKIILSRFQRSHL